MDFLFQALWLRFFLSVILSSIDIQFVAVGMQRKLRVYKITPFTLILIEPQQQKGNL